ncbi:trans-2,3-dihydro-3-hydroxyanthranilate isomerase [Pseudonocardia sediminis]|uniref:Trans-2,3-dihydro-3-hydroxyanthranilate isomerase n=1 Tax=Pseudonocardia sediminis TaxID=1397368 RepID=A0A4Q7UQZ4_PSEST|nr:PhzF family phenazine biosynthesis protein [Pseudonocardia sediminis]RZT84092.1 trans-2,3-dihydro-3-hydroxyanthranilate isomerase [Pseudonocardia sediminis]
MSGLHYDVVDVFTDRPYAGNPLAVVRDADDLTGEQMQAIATEFNLSETTFTLPPTDPSADYRVRIFTPARELPFAGHPSVGTGWVLARDGVIALGDRVQECGAGLLSVEVDELGARVTGGAPSVGDDLDAGLLATAVGLDPDDVDGAAAPGVAGAGVDYGFLLVRDDAVARAVCDAAAVRAVTGGTTALGLVVCSVDPDARQVHLRMFGTGVGVAEDPATGSAAVALGVFLADRGLVGPEEAHGFTVAQGAEIGRPSTLHAWVRAEGGAAVATWVGGNVVPIARGELTARPGDRPYLK